MNRERVYKHLKALPIEQRVQARSRIIADARRAGFNGFGGLCGAAAVVLRRTLFGPEAGLRAALNRAFLAHDRAIGHAAVLDGDGRYWDADGRPKPVEHIESWAMLDAADLDYAEAAAEAGFEWSEEAAYEVTFVDYDADEDCLAHFGGREHVERLQVILGAAAERWLRTRVDSIHPSAGI